MVRRHRSKAAKHRKKANLKSFFYPTVPSASYRVTNDHGTSHQPTACSSPSWFILLTATGRNGSMFKLTLSKVDGEQSRSNVSCRYKWFNNDIKNVGSARIHFPAKCNQVFSIPDTIGQKFSRHTLKSTINSLIK